MKHLKYSRLRKNPSCDRCDILAHGPCVFHLSAGLGISCSSWVTSITNSFYFKLQCKCTAETCCNIQWTYVCLSWSCSAHMHILHNKTTNARWCKLVHGFVVSDCKCPGIFAFGAYYLFIELVLWQCFYLNLTSVFFICFLFNLSISPADQHKIPCVNAWIICKHCVLFK